MGGAALTSVLPAPPKVVVDTITSVEMAALRISGETQIEPSLERKQALAAAQRYQLVVDLRVCISDLGAVTSVDVVRSSGFADYDARLVTKARAWRYRPYSLDGVAQPVCAPVRFDYRLTVPMILRR
jgi:protein TonB